MRLFHLIALSLLFAGSAVGAKAAPSLVDLVAEKAPGIFKPLVDYPVAVGEPPVCRSDIPPEIRVVLVGASEPGAPFAVLNGPDHDVALLRTSFAARGVPSGNIVALTGADANREQLATVLTDTLNKTNCGDRIWLHFGGHSAPAAELMAVLLDLAEVPEDVPDLLLFALNTQIVGRTELVSASDVSEFVTVARNRMADVVVSLDTSYAASAQIAAMQAASEIPHIWRQEIPNERSSEDEASGVQTRLLPSHGDFAVIYSSVEDSHSIELSYASPGGGRTTYGNFTFRLATAIQTSETVSVRGLADGLEAPGAETRGQRFRIEASNPDLTVVASDGGLPRSEPIVITSPARMRGAAVMQKPVVDIAGVVNWSAPVRAVLVNGAIADLHPGEEFRAHRKLKPGLNTIEIVALTGDGRTHRKTLELKFEGDIEALAGSGNRYAIVIANQGYELDRTGFGPLATPFADADALVETLERDFGFATTATAGGREFSLVLKDATRRDIETVLYKIGTVAGENDTVLIYYAGHGFYEARTTIAFWIPVDGESGVPISFVSASSISEAVQRMQAKKVVVISDSCYSGALMRGGVSLATSAGSNRDAMLLRLAQKRTRLLISSGANEPVEDGGGSGHSVFARALLTGLREMGERSFSSRELFERYIIPMVTDRAPQEPQFRPLDRTGHDGGDIVFVRTERSP